MDERSASTSANWLDRLNALAFIAAAGDLSEDSIFLHDSIIRGHLISKDIWTPDTFQPVVEVKNAMPIKCMRLINNSL